MGWPFERLLPYLSGLPHLPGVPQAPCQQALSEKDRKCILTAGPEVPWAWPERALNWNFRFGSNFLFSGLIHREPFHKDKTVAVVQNIGQIHLTNKLLFFIVCLFPFSLLSHFLSLCATGISYFIELSHTFEKGRLCQHLLVYRQYCNGRTHYKDLIIQVLPIVSPTKSCRL